MRRQRRLCAANLAGVHALGFFGARIREQKVVEHAQGKGNPLPGLCGAGVHGRAKPGHGVVAAQRWRPVTGHLGDLQPTGACAKGRGDQEVSYRGLNWVGA